MSANYSTDLTEGGVAKRLLRFSLPFLLSTFIQQLYNMADMVIVSYFGGAASEAGVSGVYNGGQVTFLATALAIGISVGGTILVGQYFGAKRMDDLKKTVSTMMTALIAAAVLMTVLFLVFDDQILTLLRVPADSFSEAKGYLDVCLIGLIFIFMYNSISGVMRGMGDSKRPLIFVGGACLLNVGLDFLFVAGFHMGARGAAIATVISQAASVLVSALYLAKSGFVFDFMPKSFKVHREKLRLIMQLGIPAGVQQLFVTMSFMVMTVLVNGYEVDASAAAGLTARFNGFAILPSMAISNSVSMMCAQNFGAKRHDRAIHTMRLGMVMAAALSVIVFAAAQFFPEQVMRLFSNKQGVIDQGVIYMRAFSWDYLIVPFTFNLSGIFNGGGHTTVTLVSSVLSSVALRVPAALLLSQTLGLQMAGVGYAAPLASAGALVFLGVFFLTGRWKTAVINKSPAAAAAEV
ncbi:MAG: MATE family efflux transporter [Oscillospiraceae bacterium]|nr:MATE family efflux transporter [Oscillospiraceae bacterium]